MLAEVINPIQIRQQTEIREKLAALKEKRLLNQKLGYESQNTELEQRSFFEVYFECITIPVMCGSVFQQSKDPRR